MNQAEKGLSLDMLNNGGAMDNTLLNEFIDYVEKQLGQTNKQEYICDGRGTYQKDLYVDNIISETRELIKYGETVIALENMLDNLCEVSLFIDAHAINLIRRTFNGMVPERIETILNSFMEK